jgi:hypothetical protein
MHKNTGRLYAGNETEMHHQKGFKPMSNLNDSQKWALVAFVAGALMIANTFFLQGDVRTFGYIIISLGVAAYAVITSGGDEKKKNDQPKDQ